MGQEEHLSPFGGMDADTKNASANLATANPVNKKSGPSMVYLEEPVLQGGRWMRLQHVGEQDSLSIGLSIRLTASRFAEHPCGGVTRPAKVSIAPKPNAWLARSAQSSC